MKLEAWRTLQLLLHEAQQAQALQAAGLAEARAPATHEVLQLGGAC